MENKLQELDTIAITCIECNTIFTMSPAEQKFYTNRGYNLPKRCKKCRDSKKEVKEFICKDCNKVFTLNTIELSYFTRMGLSTPKRCPSCIEIKKQRNQEVNGEV